MYHSIYKFKRKQISLGTLAFEIQIGPSWKNSQDRPLITFELVKVIKIKIPDGSHASVSHTNTYSGLFITNSYYTNLPLLKILISRFKLQILYRKFE